MDRAPRPDTSVVIVTCNRVGVLEHALRSIFRQEMPADWSFELVVVDDGSRDGTAELLQRLTAESPVPMRVLHTTGLGVPAARNLGANAAEGRWIASFDDDQVAHPTWLASLRAAAESTQSACFGGALLLSLPVTCDPARLGSRARKLLGEHLVSSHLAPYPRGCFPATNNALVAREVFHTVGGFDTNFHQGGSDTDFFRRVEAAGHTIWFVPSATAEHLIPPSRVTETYLRWTCFKVAAGAMRMLRKDDIPGIVRLMFLRTGTTLLRDLPALARARMSHNSAARLDAHCSLWFTQGVFRCLLAYAAPGSRHSRGFWDGLNFRRHNGERTENT